MLKKVYYPTLLAVLLACLVPLFTVSAAPEQQVSYAAGTIDCETSVEAEFPLQLHFDISAESDAEITEIRLHYATSRESFVPVSSEAIVEFTPDTSVDARWSWDMRRTGGLPTGTEIRYWWSVRDASGNAVSTPERAVSFDDNRYQWQEISEGNVTIHWYEGDQDFAEQLMIASRQALVRLQGGSGAGLTGRADIYIYDGSGDLQGAMVFSQEWTGGAAYPEYGIIVLGISPGNLEWGIRSIAHELTHLVVHQMTDNPFSRLPTWLDEGLAMYAEGPLERQFLIPLENAIEEDRLLSVRTVSSPFSTDTEKAILSYAESYSLVDFLTTEYGQDKMLALLKTFHSGTGYLDALESVYGLNMDSLNDMWIDSTGR